MSLFAPKYYTDFVCIADQCKHSCCIGWEIDVDDATMGAYNVCSHEYGKIIRESIDTNETPHFRLCDGDRCPHLNESGLCKIILSLGEDYLCDICREHPRFYHDTVRGKEVGLGMSCEEACRIILSSDDYNKMIEIEEDCSCENVEFDAIAHREWIFSILSNRAIPYDDRLKMIRERYNISLDVLTDTEWRDVFSSLEYLEESHKFLFAIFSTVGKSLTSLEHKLERAFAYFVFRHCSSACDEGELRASLGFSMLCERLLVFLCGNDPTAKIETWAQIVSEELEYSEENTECLREIFFE